MRVDLGVMTGLGVPVTGRLLPAWSDPSPQRKGAAAFQPPASSQFSFSSSIKEHK